MLRSQTNWSTRPGSFDVLHIDRIFESKSAYDFPEIGAFDINFPGLVIAFNSVTRAHAPSLVHTFIEDYQLERVWKKPAHYLRHLDGDVFISPDFSLYTDMPLALQIFNTYKNRWVGRFMQEYGIQVVPSVSWSTKESFDFCFEGIAHGSTVAISSSGTKRTDISPFMNGVEQMLKRVTPSMVLCYGSTRKAELDLIYNNITYLPTFTESIRERVKNKSA